MRRSNVVRNHKDEVSWRKSYLRKLQNELDKKKEEKSKDEKTK